MSDSNWEAPTPGTAADTAKPHWSKRKAGPLPVWGWIASGMVLVGIIGAFTDQSDNDETSIPITVETEEDRERREEAEEWFGELQEDWEALEDFFEDRGVSGTDEMVGEDLESFEDFYDSLSDKTSETADRVLTVIESLREDAAAADDDEPEVAEVVDDDEPEVAEVVDDDEPEVAEVVDDEDDASVEEPDCNVYEEDCGSPTPCCDLITPTEYLALLTIAEEGSRDDFNPDDWSHWHIKDWSGCSSREEVLVRTAIGDTSWDPDDPCEVVDGWWYSEYDGTWTSESSEIEIDHVVGLSEAHVSGAWDWTSDQREWFANDLQNLVAVSPAAEQSKGDSDAAGWWPHEDVWCSFAYTVVEVKFNYGLTVDPAEHAALAEMIETCVPPMSESYNWWRLRNGDFYQYSDISHEPPTTR